MNSGFKEGAVAGLMWIRFRLIACCGVCMVYELLFWAMIFPYIQGCPLRCGGGLAYAKEPDVGGTCSTVRVAFRS